MPDVISSVEHVPNRVVGWIKTKCIRGEVQGALALLAACNYGPHVVENLANCGDWIYGYNI